MYKKILISALFFILETSSLFAFNQDFKKDSIQSRTLFNAGAELTGMSNFSEAIDSFKGCNSTQCIRSKLQKPGGL